MIVNSGFGDARVVVTGLWGKLKGGVGGKTGGRTKSLVLDVTRHEGSDRRGETKS